MDLNELIERLTDIRDELGTAEVVLAHQPNWPLAFDIANVRSIAGVVWIAGSEGNNHEHGPYAPNMAWEEDW